MTTSPSLDTGGGAVVGQSVDNRGGAFIGRDQNNYYGVAPPPTAPLIPTPPSAPQLFGRALLLAELVAQLAQTPQLGLYGLAGVGKTALLLALANDARMAAAFPAGRIWIECGPNADLFSLLGKVLVELGQPPDHLTDSALRAARLRQLLAGQPCLLLVDDVWQAAVAGPLLAACPPPAAAVVTMRYPTLADDLHLVTHEVPVLDDEAALDLLAAAGAAAGAAAQVDVAGARALLVELGYLPLALQVVGRRLNSLARADGPALALRTLRQDLDTQLLQLTAVQPRPGIADLKPSLAAVLALSYDHLPDDQARRALRQLGVFGGQPLSFTQAALAAVWATPDAGAAAALRLALSDAGLLARLTGGNSPADAEPRYALHQIVARFAAARLQDDPAAAKAARVAHAAFYATIVARWDDAVREGRMTYSAPLEWENVALALDRLCAPVTQAVAQDDDLSRALLSYAQHWRNVLLNNYDQRRLAWLQAAVTAAQHVGSAWEQANVLKAQGDVLQFLKEMTAALAKYEAALTLYRAVGSHLGEANVLKAQGDVLQFLDQREAALAKYEAALTLYRAVGDRLGEANVLKAQGEAALKAGSIEPGLALLDHARQLYAQIGARVGQANLGIILGRHAAAQGDYAAAIAYMQPAADFCHAMDHPLGPQLQAEITGWQVDMYRAAGNTATESGEWAQAVANFQQAIALAPEDATLRRNCAEGLIKLQQFAAARHQLESAAALEPDAPYLALRWAELAKAQADRAEAAAWAKVALERQPEWADARTILAWATSA